MPAREPGYYWVMSRPAPEGFAPQVALYGPTTCRDQALDAEGRLTDLRIVSGYAWTSFPQFAGDDALWSDDAVSVVSERLIPPVTP